MNLWRLLRGVVYFLTFGSVAMAAPVVQVTVHVIDEQGQNIEGATIELTLIQSSPESVGAGTEVVEGGDGSGGPVYRFWRKRMDRGVCRSVQGGVLPQWRWRANGDGQCGVESLGTVASNRHIEAEEHPESSADVL